MRIRGANVKDYAFINSLYKNHKFNFEPKHVEQIIVAEDSTGIVAVGTLTTHLEVAFVTVNSRSRKSKVLALAALMNQVDIETKNLGYDHIHAFATNELILRILKRKFNFVRTEAIQVLVRFIMENSIGKVRSAEDTK